MYPGVACLNFSCNFSPLCPRRRKQPPLQGLQLPNSQAQKDTESTSSHPGLCLIFLLYAEEEPAQRTAWAVWVFVWFWARQTCVMGRGQTSPWQRCLTLLLTVAACRSGRLLPSLHCGVGRLLHRRRTAVPERSAGRKGGCPCHLAFSFPVCSLDQSVLH